MLNMIKMSTNFNDLTQIEQKYNVTNLIVNGVYIWDHIRFGVYNEIREELSGSVTHDRPKTTLVNKLRKISLLATNLIYKNPFLEEENSCILYGHERRKKEDDGYYWDIYTDTIHNLCSIDGVSFESDHLLKHNTPAKTDKLRYLDLVKYGSSILRKLIRYTPNIPDAKLSKMQNIEYAIQRKFGISVSIINRVMQKLSQRKFEIFMYKSILRSVSPKIVVVVVSYGKEIFIEACQSLNIPVIELQHGYISDNHSGYHFPGSLKKEYFPDYLLTWGEHWSSAASFPINDENIIDVGFPYIEIKKQNIDYTNNKIILFISQGTVGKELSKFAVSVAKQLDNCYKVVYKLHPGEYKRWEDEYSWLLNDGITVISDEKHSLYRLFSRAILQIGVNSTALFEGTYFDVPTLLYTETPSKVSSVLIDKSGAKKVTSAREVIQQIGVEREVIPNKYMFFSKNAKDKMCSTLSSLIDQK